MRHDEAMERHDLSPVFEQGQRAVREGWPRGLILIASAAFSFAAWIGIIWASAEFASALAR